MRRRAQSSSVGCHRESLLLGLSVSDAALRAGVNRTSVHRWLKNDWNFQAALNRGRTDLRNAVHARLTSVAIAAADVVGQAIHAGDVKAALAVLKGLHFLEGPLPEVPNDDAQALKATAEEETLRSLWDQAPYSFSVRGRSLYLFSNIFMNTKKPGLRWCDVHVRGYKHFVVV